MKREVERQTVMRKYVSKVLKYRKKVFNGSTKRKGDKKRDRKLTEKVKREND